MAIRGYTKLPPFYKRGVHVYEWTGLLAADTGLPIRVPSHMEKTVEVSGAVGVGGSITIQGRNGETGTYAALHNRKDAAALTFTALAVPVIEAIEENPTEIRPNVTAGDGATTYTVRLTCTSVR